MTKVMNWLYEKECTFFRLINGRMHRSSMDRFFQMWTHLGGATATISTAVLLLFLLPEHLKSWGIICMFSLIISHIPVAISKKMYPRKRPYLSLPDTNIGNNPLKDHSFPSGHTTAIFSIVTPLIILNPFIGMFLLFAALLVAISRMYLGLHYPSDVLAGMILGISSSFFSLFLVKAFMLPYLY
ncbi:phosphatase PAP2 family protein [Fictibacillus nanhaiensis]|uniref:phosphatase PAP2 family protein n=1 Tax=Fictibacillus nanhaiensis TaxID=742169 RepID=UPI0020414816|nr:phosphatase PAP2 family protein [Fictibacillus nanhaiensis]